MSRAQRYSTYHARYKKHYTDDNKHSCGYCGEPADTIDHVPSLDMVDTYGADHYYDNGVELLLVPACRECNSTLSNTDHPFLQNRAMFLQNKYLSKYEKFIDMPEWTDEEISQLGKNLKHKIKRSKEQSLRIKRRLDHLSILSK